MGLGPDGVRAAAGFGAATRAGGILYTGAMEPAEVLQVLHGDVAEATLQRVVRQLRGDPAWSVGPSLEQPTAHILRFVYRPQQLAYEFHALRVHPDRWHIVPQQPRPAARPE
jgi:hypothetical protein